MRLFGIPDRWRRFLREEQGTGTLMALFFVLISGVIGGLAIDFNKAMARRTHLQVTVDAVAHAALYTRERKTKPPKKHADLERMLRQDGGITGQEEFHVGELCLGHPTGC